jgi:biotin carboxylase
MKKILIIGAGFLQAFVIKKAKSMGYETLAVDADPNAVGFGFADEYEVINIVDENACLAYAKKEKIDGVLTAATDYGVLTASRIAEEMGLNGISQDAAKRIKNKYFIRKCLYDNCVDDTEQAYLVDESTDIEEISQRITYPVMVKPCDGSGSRGASRVDKKADLYEALQYAMSGSITHRAVIESFVVGNEYGVESFVENGNIHVLAIMKKWMTKPPYYAELGHAVPSGLSNVLENKIKKCVTNAINALGVNFGSVNMDILVTDNGSVHIVDVGARMGGNLIGSHIVPMATGIDYMGNMIKAAVGDAVDFSKKEQRPVATRLLALTPGVVKALPDFDDLEEKYNVIIEHHLKLGDEITFYRTNLDGCGYVVASENTVEESSQRAEQVRKIIDDLIVR